MCPGLRCRVLGFGLEVWLGSFRMSGHGAMADSLHERYGMKQLHVYNHGYN